jgi:hypothetical protein
MVAWRKSCYALGTGLSWQPVPFHYSRITLRAHRTFIQYSSYTNVQYLVIASVCLSLSVVNLKQPRACPLAFRFEQNGAFRLYPEDF